METRFIDLGETDNCPVHSGEVRKEYEFGMRDAEVLVYYGCKCAVCVNCEANDLDRAATYHTSYADAAGRARLIKAQASLPL